MEVCDECGFEYRLEGAGAAGAAILDGVAALAALLRAGSDSASRRTPEMWSPLEYCCHVRDVLLVQRERVLLARRQPRPSLAPMGREERVEHDGYAHQHPEAVAGQLLDAGLLFANVLSRLGDGDWERTLIYNYPDAAERSLRWVAVHTLHEVHHHLLDVNKQQPI